MGEVFTPTVLQSLGQGDLAVGHVRYGTTGTGGRSNAQPMLVNHIKGRMALAHNGNLTNSTELRTQLELEGSIFHSTSDTEVISYIITKERIHSKSIEEAVEKGHGPHRGRLFPGHHVALQADRRPDKHGFRPLCYGQTDDGTYIVASESCALDAVAAKFIRDIEPGEILVFERGKEPRSITTHCGQCPRSLCVFEYIYFARPDSVIDGCNVHAARARAGAFLALEHPAQADVVIGVPDSGIDAAVGYASSPASPMPSA